MDRIYAERTFANRIVAANNADTVVLTIEVPTGTWQIGGQIGVTYDDPSRPCIHIHADHGVLDGIETAPAQGATMAEHITYNQQNGGCRPLGQRFYTFASPTVVKLRVQPTYYNPNLSGYGTGKAYGTLWGVKLSD